MWGDGPCLSRWLYDALDLKCAPCPALSMGWPWRLAFILLSSLRDCRELGVRILMMNPGWWHLPAWHTGTAPTQHGASASSFVRWGGRGHSKVKSEVGRGKVSENLALVIALWSRAHFLSEEMGVAGTSLETPEYLGVTLGKALETETGAWEPRPQSQALSWGRRQKMDPPPSRVRSKGCRDGP